LDTAAGVSGTEEDMVAVADMAGGEVG
jgi:hypothetical protein